MPQKMPPGGLNPTQTTAPEIPAENLGEVHPLALVTVFPPVGCLSEEPPKGRHITAKEDLQQAAQPECLQDAQEGA